MLSTPPAFILSQDQTLVKNVCIRVRIAWQFCSCLLFWFDIFRCPFLKNLFKEFSGFVVYCSVINVLFVVAVSCDSFYIISKRFMFVNNFFISFLLLWSSPSRDSLFRIAYSSRLVNSFLISFCNLLFSKFSSEYSHTHARIFMQNFLFFIRSASACHSLVSVSASEHMVSYHGFPELSMLFLYFAQFRIFWHHFNMLLRMARLNIPFHLPFHFLFHFTFTKSSRTKTLIQLLVF